jgi:hypothetical protein
MSLVLRRRRADQSRPDGANGSDRMIVNKNAK